MATADQAVAVFDSFVGISESPPHSNRTPIGAEFGWNGVAWCAETCSVVLNRTFGHHVLWTASVAQAIADAANGVNGLRLLGRGDVIAKGDLVTYDWGGHGNSDDFHIAMVRDPGTQAKFQTDGGNEGDAVRQQWRDRTFVSHFIRPPFDNTASTAPTAPKEEDMAEPGAAVDAHMNGDGTGWVLDRWGGIDTVGNAPAAVGGPYWPGQDAARKLIMLDPAKPSGYVLDLRGALHPFGGAPAVKTPAPYWP